MKDYILLNEYMRRFNAGIPYEGYILCPDGILLYSTYESVCMAPSFMAINNPKPFAAPGEDTNEIITAVKARVVGQINYDNVASKLMKQQSDGSFIINRSDGPSMKLPRNTRVKVSLDSDGYRTLLELRSINGEVKRYEYASIIDFASNFGISPDLAQAGTEQIERVWDWLSQFSTSNQAALITGVATRAVKPITDILVRQGRYLSGELDAFGMTKYTKDVMRTTGDIVINNRLGSFSVPAKAVNATRVALKYGGNTITGLGIGLTLARVLDKDNDYRVVGEGGFDLAMSGVAFVLPPYGLIASGLYFGGKLIFILCDGDAGCLFDENGYFDLDALKW